jgi:hypothetical protein
MVTVIMRMSLVQHLASKIVEYVIEAIKAWIMQQPLIATIEQF